MNQPAEKRERKKIIKSLNLLAINRPFYEIGYRAVVKFNGHQIQNTHNGDRREVILRCDYCARSQQHCGYEKLECWPSCSETPVIPMLKLSFAQRQKKLASHKTNHLLTDLNYIWADAQFFFCTHSPVIAC